MKQYKEHLEAILAKGTHKPAARENMPGTTSLFGYQWRHDLSDGFPLLTTKKVYWKGVVIELLWFLRGDTNVKYLNDNGVTFWNEDQQNFQNKNNWTEKGSLGYQYPWLWRSWGKEDRRWQPKANFKDPFFSSQLPEIKSSKSKFIGNVIKTVQGYEYLIYDYNSTKNIYYIVFIHNGLLWEKKTSKSFDKVEYPYHKTCMNIACIGRVDKNYDKKLYSVWKGMLTRCYDKNNISYNLYGGKGIYVNNRWLCLEYFIEDVKLLKNWDLKQSDWNKYTLEKDFGRGFVYSKDDCIWSQYNFSRLDRPLFYIFENKETKEKYRTNNLANFGRYINKEKLINSHSKKLIEGKLKSLGGWTLLEIEDFKNQGIDQLKELITGLKSNPMGRRHVISAWNPTTLNDMALNACHAFVQFNCRPIQHSDKIRWCQLNLPNQTEYDLQNNDSIPKYYLDCQLYQRSADTFLGVPLNVASYALLTHIIAKVCGMEPGEMVYSYGDSHIYDNHIEQVKEQLTREERPLPTLSIGLEHMNWEIPDIDLIINEILLADPMQVFQLENYNPHPPIKGELSTGLIK